MAPVVPFWLILGLVTVLLWGLAFFFGKLATNHIPGSSTKIYLFIGNIFATAYAFHLTGFHLERHYGAGTMAMAAGLLTAFANLFLYIGLNRGGPASLLVPLSNIYTLVTFAMAYLLLHERVTASQGAGVVLALVAIILMG
jgi:uncharacterized membrane protein